jgi:signal transduction histidine kinase
MANLIDIIQKLSSARSLDAVMVIVRHAARELTGADGATFVLRERDKCFYAEEDAIAPLWKGQRFPLSACISGWAMLNKRPAVIEDIYADSRIPIDAYRPTFVKSLVMVPIRTADPIGAIGNYWAKRHLATAEEVELLQALANTTSVAIENVQLYAELEQRVKDRTAQLELANRELEAFSYTVSHDLRSPLQTIAGFAELLSDSYAGTLDAQAQKYLRHISSTTERMAGLINDLLTLSQVEKSEMHVEPTNLSSLARSVADELRSSDPARQVEFVIQNDVMTEGDPRFLRVAMENLLRNAWKYSSRRSSATIEFGCRRTDEEQAFFVRDNGAGFDPKEANRLFGAFQRLHSPADFPGTGVGLATVRRIIQRHNGKIWAEGEVGKGATFYFTVSPQLATANSGTVDPEACKA